MNLKLNKSEKAKEQLQRVGRSLTPTPQSFRRLAKRNPSPEALLRPKDGDTVRRASALVLEKLTQNKPLSLRELLLPLYIQSLRSPSIRGDALSVWKQNEQTLWLPRFHFRRPGTNERRIKVGIFAGIHGDEPAGILGLMDFIRELDETPEIGHSFELWLYPACNPGGWMTGTRHALSGKDLNREFWIGSDEKEVALLETELRAQRFDGIISLHSDDTSPGFYGYARGDVLARQLLEPALEAAEYAQSRDTRPFIDGFQAVNGIIHDAFDGILSAPPEQSPKPFEIILESPALSSLADQRRAFTLALKAVLTEYRQFIAYGADL